MDILVAFFASTTILFFVACLKLVFKLIDTAKEDRSTAKELAKLTVITQGIFKYLTENNNNTQT